MDQPFASQLARLDARIEREILRLRARYQLSLDEFRLEFILPYMDFYRKFDSSITKRQADEVYEAATVDGANVTQRFWHVTLPMLRPIIVVATVTSHSPRFMRNMGRPINNIVPKNSTR